MVRASVLAGLTLLGCTAAVAQDQRLSFDVASIRPAAPRPVGGFIPGAPGSPRPCPLTGCGGPGTGEPERITFTFVTVTHLIWAAFDVEPYQVEVPDGLDAARFDVIATLPAGATREQANLMLQNLLADRFQLKIHRETRELPVYALVVAPGGAKLKSPDDPTAPSAVAKGRGTVGTGPRKRFEFDGWTMAQFVSPLAREVSRPVVDRTGLTGRYDVRLEFAPSGSLPALPGDQQAVEIFTALTEQLGLKLEPGRGPVEVLVVDSVSKQPTEN